MEKLKDKSFEELLDNLEVLVQKMERGDIHLEELLVSYDQGSKMVDECRKRLAKFSKKIEVLTSDKGEGEWSDFNANTTRIREVNNNEDNGLF